MSRGKRTSIHHAAEAKALADIGYPGTQIAEATGLPVRTVDDIINGRNGWGEIIANDQAFKQYRSDAKRKMQAASINLSQKGTPADREQNRQGECATGRDGLRHLARQRKTRRGRAHRDHCGLQPRTHTGSRQAFAAVVSDAATERQFD
jgi:hypothetical protein